ncbi:fumarylacetoacetate hydrolase family protein [Pseudonocardia broussonetiae]|nr:fumarylacetoacetate hydrolase family protein [Pseudonocardia broussonetiae]
MRLVSFLDRAGTPSVGVVDGDVISDLGALLGPAPAAGTGLSPMRRLLARTGGDLSSVREHVAAAPRLARSEVTLQPPVPDPTKIVAAPVNYTDHQHEMNEAVHVSGLGVFLKAPSSLVPSGGTVRLPYHDRRFDQEGELGVVIGRRARNVRAADALDVVAGYTNVLDMTLRGGEDRSVRKSFDTFTPCGPHLVTPDEVGPLDRLELRCAVNGVLRQHADVADLIWDVPRLVEYVSSVMTLEPGDVLTTGTPAGVGEVRDGDEISTEVTHLGRLTVGVSGRGATACPTSGAGRGPVPPAELTPLRR